MRCFGWLFGGVGFFALLAACGGSIGGIDGSSSGGSSGASSGSSGSSGASSSGGASSGSSGGSSSGSSGATCQTNGMDGNRACVPGTGSANTPITIDVQATENCMPCFTTMDACKVSVTGNKISVALTATTCTPKGDVGCPAICAYATAKCTIPPLPAGSYTVEVQGEGFRQPTRELVLQEKAAAASCELPPAGPPVPPLDGSKYSTSCSVDEDCRAIVTGALCQVCAPCPNAAIAKLDTSYDSDYRARASQCPTRKDPVACAACQAPTVKCEVKGNELTGTCKLL